MVPSNLVKRLIEEPEDQLNTNLDLPDLGHYTGPVEFDTNIRHVIDYARQLKQQAQEAGAYGMLAGYSAVDIDRAFLTVAVQKYNEEMVQPARAAKMLRRHMHSIWD